MLSVWRVAHDVPAGTRHIVHAESHGQVVGLVFSTDQLCRHADFQLQFVRLVHKRSNYLLEPLRSFGVDTLFDVAMVALRCNGWINSRLATIEAEESEANEQTAASDGCAFPGGNGTGAA